MEKIHKSLIRKESGYKEWHEMKHNQLLAWLVFVVVAFMAANVVQFSIDMTSLQDEMLAATVTTRVTVTMPEKSSQQFSFVYAVPGKVANTSAVINWATSQAASVVVHYGAAKGDFSSVTQATAPGITGALSVSGLIPNTQYRMQLEAMRSPGNARATSALLEIRTPNR